MRKDIKILDAWINDNKLVIKGLVDGMEIRTIAKMANVPDEDGKVFTSEALKELLVSVRQKIVKA